MIMKALKYVKKALTINSDDNDYKNLKKELDQSNESRN